MLLRHPRVRLLYATIVPALLFASGARLKADDQPQWGQRFSRNMVSDETGLPDRFDPASDLNIKWTAALGTACYGSPVVAQGRVLIGTNNNQPRDPRHSGDRGVLMCFHEADGQLAWQLVAPKLEGDVYLDWPQAGMCSPPTIEGDRVYLVTNRAEVVCLDLAGLANGNGGPFVDEGRHMTPGDQAALELGPWDADLLWVLDLRTAAGVRPHDSSHCSILLDGPYLYVNTSNGLNSRHEAVDRPEAPSLVVVDKHSGQLLAREREGISRQIFHSTWSSPALGSVGDRRLVFFCGGDGICYAFDALRPEDLARWSAGAVGDLQLVWRFDCDPTAPKENIHRYIRNRRESPSNIKSMPVFYQDRLFVTVGGDIWWGKRQSWLQCIDARGTGEITGSALLWSYAMPIHCCATPAIHEGLAYVADCAGKLHCVDIRDGRPVWVHDAGSEIWASPLVADGKLYIGTRRGDFWVLAAGRQLQVLSSIALDSGVYSTAVAANGTLYVATMTQLHAIQQAPAAR